MKKPVKSDDMARLGTLAAALAKFRQLEHYAKRDTVMSSTEGDRMAVEITVGAVCDDGGCSYADIELDMVTGRKLLPLVRKLIKDELKALGVET